MSKDNNLTTGPTLAWKRQVEELFDAALDLPPEERAIFLERACANDALRREVEDLLEVEREQSLGLLPSGDLAMPSGVADLHPSLKGLPLVPGMQIGRYELLRSLGQGGMGTVFLAYDKRLRRRVAIKFLHAATPEMTLRFLAEARTTARCKHENIVILYDVDEVDGYPYMVLEHLEGESLRQRLAGLEGNRDTASATPAARRREAGAVTPAMPVADVLSLVIPVVRALVWAHKQGIVHRDLKPENIFLCSNGIIKVLDFGIAKVLTDTYGSNGITGDVAIHATTQAEHMVTAQGALLGTLPYMSPEQWGTGAIDERTDIWAMGIMLYEMLAGRHPLAPLSYARLERLVPDLDTPMPAIGDTVTGLGALASLLDHCLRKRSAERMATAWELLNALVDIHWQDTEPRPRRASAPFSAIPEQVAPTPSGPLQFASISIDARDLNWREIREVPQRYPFDRPCSQRFRLTHWIGNADPMYDIVLLNVGDSPVILTAIYVQVLVACEVSEIWERIPRSIPQAAKIPKSDSYVLQMPDIKPVAFDKPQDVQEVIVERLRDPIYLEPRAPYRYGLLLKEYSKNFPVWARIRMGAATNQGESWSGELEVVYWMND
jgi:serine/threonine protein kinase